MSLSIIGIIVALICLMILVYKKVNIILASIICCLITAFFSGLPLLTSLKESYMPGFAEFIINNFLIFAFSALFGKLMEVSGAAASFAKMMYSVLGTKYSVFGCMIATSLLVYGGVSNFVIVFTMFPIFRSVFKKADLPHTLIPGVIYAASATYAASMLPGYSFIEQPDSNAVSGYPSHSCTCCRSDLLYCNHGTDFLIFSV